MMKSINRRMTKQINSINDLTTNNEVKIIVADMTTLYTQPDNNNRFSWFVDVFVGACLLHSNDLQRTMDVVNKFNQQLKEPLTKYEQDLILAKLERRLCDETQASVCARERTIVLEDRNESFPNRCI